MTTVACGYRQADLGARELCRSLGQCSSTELSNLDQSVGGRLLGFGIDGNNICGHHLRLVRLNHRLRQGDFATRAGTWRTHHDGHFLGGSRRR